MVILHCTILSHNKNQITGLRESTAMQAKDLSQKSGHSMSHDAVSDFLRRADTYARFSFRVYPNRSIAFGFAYGFCITLGFMLINFGLLLPHYL